MNQKTNKALQLKKLKTASKNCVKCPLGTLGRTQIVFGEGSVDAKLMFIGEAPGQNEDKQGSPFVGRAGRLLTELLLSINLKREDVYISNVAKCRPPKNRTPNKKESEQCKKLYLFKEIKIISPQIICPLGACATQALLGSDIKISHSRGKILKLNDYIIIPTYHPAYLLRNPSAKTIVLEDLQKIQKLLNNA